MQALTPGTRWNAREDLDCPIWCTATIDGLPEDHVHSTMNSTRTIEHITRPGFTWIDLEQDPADPEPTIRVRGSELEELDLPTAERVYKELGARIAQARTSLAVTA